jgi:hypothetical protein
MFHLWDCNICCVSVKRYKGLGQGKKTYVVSFFGLKSPESYDAPTIFKAFQLGCLPSLLSNLT